MKLSLAAALAAGLAFAAPAYATPLGNGTVSVANLVNPTVNLTSNPNTYTISTGQTFEISGTGAFSNLSGTLGTDSGTLSFSSTIGATIAQTVANFFTFSDAAGGTYNFSVNSVQTLTFSNQPGVASAFGLYVLGTTIDSNLGETTPTLTSLTIQATSTGSSAYSSSQTLSTPPTAVPEPMSLALLGSGLRIRRASG